MFPQQLNLEIMFAVPVPIEINEHANSALTLKTLIFISTKNTYFFQFEIIINVFVNSFRLINTAIINIPLFQREDPLHVDPRSTA